MNLSPLKTFINRRPDGSVIIIERQKVTNLIDKKVGEVHAVTITTPNKPTKQFIHAWDVKTKDYIRKGSVAIEYDSIDLAVDMLG